MIDVINVSVNFSGQPLFKDVNLKFTPGNCYGVIGANGAGKSTFLRVLSGNLEPTTGDVAIKKGLHFFLGDGFFARGIDRNLIRVKK